MAYGLHELGPEHYLTLRAATDLSIAMRRIPADYDEALELAADTLEQCRLRRGEENPDTMAAAISLSNILRRPGRLPRRSNWPRKRRKRTQRLRRRAPYNYGCIGNLAVLRRLAGDPTGPPAERDGAGRAGPRLTATISSRSPSPSTSPATSRRSVTHEAARALGEDSLARLTRLFGDDHFLTLSCAANLALDLRADGAAEEARAFRPTTSTVRARPSGPA